MKSGIAPEVNQRARIDVCGEIGQVSGSVKMTGTAGLLQTETTAASSVVSGSTIVDDAAYQPKLR